MSTLFTCILFFFQKSDILYPLHPIPLCNPNSFPNQTKSLRIFSSFFSTLTTINIFSSSHDKSSIARRSAAAQRRWEWFLLYLLGMIFIVPFTLNNHRSLLKFFYGCWLFASGGGSEVKRIRLVPMIVELGGMKSVSDQLFE